LTDEELYDLKNRVIDAMIAVHGVNYTLGWLRGSYLTPVSDAIEYNILKDMLSELEHAQSEMLDTVRVGL
jgi:hypothetical protein